jgi:hypothetical protein
MVWLKRLKMWVTWSMATCAHLTWYGCQGGHKWGLSWHFIPYFQLEVMEVDTISTLFAKSNQVTNRGSRL